MEVSIRSIACILGLLVSLFFVLCPITIKTPKKVITLNYQYMPFFIVVFLCISTCIPINVVVRGILGANAPLWAQDPDYQTKLVPLTILLMFFSISYICLSADASGLFRIIANKFASIALRSKYPEYIGLLLFFTFSVIFTLFTSNDIVVLTLTPVIIQFIKQTKSKSLLPFLLVQFVSANTFSAGLLSGNLSNFILSAVFNIDFNTYLKNMLLPSILTGLFIFLYAYLICKYINHHPTSKLSSYTIEDASSTDNSNNTNQINVENTTLSEPLVVETESIQTDSIEKQDSSIQESTTNNMNSILIPNDSKKDEINETNHRIYNKDLEFNPNCIVSSMFILLMFCFFVLSSPIKVIWPGFQFWYIALIIRIFALFKDLAIQHFNKDFHIYMVVKRMPWNTPLFVLSMFVFIESLAYYGVIHDIAYMIFTYIIDPCLNSVGIFPIIIFFLLLTLLMVFILNNLPAIIAMTRLLRDPLIYSSLGNSANLAIYSIAFACNIGACFMPHCSLAGLMYTTIMPYKDVFKTFWKHGSILVLLLSFIFLGLLIAFSYIFI